MGANKGVSAFKINVLRQKLVIFCAPHAGTILGVLQCKISALRQKIVIIYATRAVANFDVL